MTAGELIGRVRALETEGATCPGCGRAVCHHLRLFSLAMGCGRGPSRCLECLRVALGVGASPMEFALRLRGYVESRACFREAWIWACEVERVPEGGVPSCPGIPDEALGRPGVAADEGG